MSSIESYGSGPMRDAGWGESDDGTRDAPFDRRKYRRTVRDLAPSEGVPAHPDAGYGYIVEEVAFAPRRIRDGVGRDVDAAARAATEALAGGDITLWYLLAQQWASVEHGGPLIRYSSDVDASTVESFEPGKISGDVFAYDHIDGYRYEVEIDDETRAEAQEWASGHVAPPVRRLVEVLI